MGVPITLATFLQGVIMNEDPLKGYAYVSLTVISVSVLLEHRCSHTVAPLLFQPHNEYQKRPGRSRGREGLPFGILGCSIEATLAYYKVTKVAHQANVHHVTPVCVSHARR